jgi:hypothetical protein
MASILTAHQPLYLPWLGFFHKVAASDLFCLWDDVQFSPNDYIHRNRIKGPNGWLWLTVPIHAKGHREKTIREMEIDNSKNWRKVHWNSLRVSYEKKAPYFDSYRDFFEGVYGRTWERLADLDEHLLTYLFRELGIPVKIVKASDLNFEGRKADRVLDMCRKLSADLYIFGELGEGYADTGPFLAERVKVYFQKYRHPVYPQLYGDFVSHLSVLDLLFSYGEKSADIILRDNPTKEDLIKKFSL